MFFTAINKRQQNQKMQKGRGYLDEQEKQYLTHSTPLASLLDAYDAPVMFDEVGQPLPQIKQTKINSKNYTLLRSLYYFVIWYAYQYQYQSSPQQQIASEEHFLKKQEVSDKLREFVYDLKEDKNKDQSNQLQGSSVNITFYLMKVYFAKFIKILRKLSNSSLTMSVTKELNYAPQMDFIMIRVFQRLLNTEDGNIGQFQVRAGLKRIGLRLRQVRYDQGRIMYMEVQDFKLRLRQDEHYYQFDIQRPGNIGVQQSRQKEAILIQENESLTSTNRKISPQKQHNDKNPKRERSPKNIDRNYFVNGVVVTESFGLSDSYPQRDSLQYSVVNRSNGQELMKQCTFEQRMAGEFNNVLNINDRNQRGKHQQLSNQNQQFDGNWYGPNMTTAWSSPVQRLKMESSNNETNEMRLNPIDDPQNSTSNTNLNRELERIFQKKEHFPISSEMQRLLNIPNNYFSPKPSVNVLSLPVSRNQSNFKTTPRVGSPQAIVEIPTFKNLNMASFSQKNNFKEIRDQATKQHAHQKTQSFSGLTMHNRNATEGDQTTKHQRQKSVDALVKVSTILVNIPFPKMKVHDFSNPSTRKHQEQSVSGQKDLFRISKRDANNLPRQDVKNPEATRKKASSYQSTILPTQINRPMNTQLRMNRNSSEQVHFRVPQQSLSKEKLQFTNAPPHLSFQFQAHQNSPGHQRNVFINNQGAKHKHQFIRGSNGDGRTFRPQSVESAFRPISNHNHIMINGHQAAHLSRQDDSGRAQYQNVYYPPPHTFYVPTKNQSSPQNSPQINFQTNAGYRNYPYQNRLY